MNRMFWQSTSDEVSPDAIPQWAIKLTATGAVMLVTILCVAAKRLGPRVAVIFTTVKVSDLIPILSLFIYFSISLLT